MNRRPLTQIVFWSRLLFFLLASALPLLHPGVLVAFDSSRIWLSFFLVPASCLFGFYAPRLRKGPRISPVSLAVLALFFCTLMIAGFSTVFVSLALQSLLAFALTWLAFRRGLVRVLYVEPPYFIWVAWRLSDFSRSSSSMLELSRGPVAAICAISAIIWILYACMIYALEYESRSAKKDAARSRVSGRGYFLTTLGILGIVVLFTFVLFREPDSVSDFVQRLNASDNRVSPPKKDSGKGLQSVDSEGNASNGKNANEGLSSKRIGKLLEAGDENWRGNQGSKSGSKNQYMVMIVESSVNPLYLAETYNERLDTIEGFTADENYYPNELALTPYLETWENKRLIKDKYRMPVSIEVYSTIPDKVTPWLPFMVEPTVLEEKNFPLRYSYRALSLVSSYSLSGVIPFVPPLSDGERSSLSQCLSVPLSSGDLKTFTSYAENLFEEGDSTAEKIKKILEGFKNCRYEVSSDDEATVFSMKRFLFETHTGDCTEFSNTAALLGRIAGIPSRVVTGYAMKRDLQTATHAKALRTIQQRFAPLEGKDPETLFLITTAHAHSWPEFYLPGLGWVDYESTQYALPPVSGGDPNAQDLVIPKFDGVADRGRPFVMPWIFLAKLLFSLVVMIFALYLLRRWCFILLLSLKARSISEKGTKARYSLFLMGLCARGYRVKRRDETPREYASAYPDLESIMTLYERALLHPSAAEKSESRVSFDKETLNFLRERRTPRVILREVFGTRDRGLL
jgi:transglutaminase-like putative cysteine protease